jgi:hypothetical protein
MTEVVVSSAIVGLMLIAALNSVGMVFRTRNVNADRLVGPALAHSLMAEILCMPYKDPETSSSTIGVDTSELASSRATFDDIDDYHNWSSANAVAKDGTPLSGYTGWGQAVTVTRANPLTGAVWTGADYGLKRITVTVTSPSARQTQIVALRSEDGVLEQPMAISTEAVTWLGAELRTGSSTKSQFVGAAVANHAADAN